MTTDRALDAWRTDGIISADQHAALSAIVRKTRVSIALELNAVLYVGVLAFAAGVGWTIRDHFAALGDAAILATLALAFTASLYYCFSRGAPFSLARVESPTFAFDYLLYLGCLTFAAALGYVEYRFHVLAASWDLYLLASAALYFALAYRFDNRFVLSLALSTLAGWFGVRVSAWDLLPSTLRVMAVLYGAVVAALGVGLHQRGIKRHFLDAYLHVAANAVLLALASGVVTTRREPLWFAALLAASIAAYPWDPIRGVRVRRLRRCVRLRRTERRGVEVARRRRRRLHLLRRVGGRGRRRADRRRTAIRTRGMRHYSADEERRIRLQAAVRTWTRSGLLDAAQCARIEDTLRTDLKRTKVWLRLALAGFTAVVVAASIALVFVTFRIRGDVPSAVTLTLAALVCFGAADYLAGVLRLYRYGVEETLASAAPVLLGIATIAFANSGGRANAHLDAVAALIVAAVSSFVVYRRFGFVYAAFAATMFASLVPFSLDVPDAMQRVCASAICGAVLSVARALRLRHGDDFPGNDCSTMQALACAGVVMYPQPAAAGACRAFADRAGRPAVGTDLVLLADVRGDVGHVDRRVRRCRS